MTKELATKIEAYHRTMSLAQEMLLRGIIDQRDYDKIDTIITKKSGLSLDSIFR